MRTYTTGHSAPYGVYASSKPLDMCFVSAEGEPLQGKPRARYIRIPTLLVIALSPLIGGVFVIAFPVLIIAALLGALAQGVVRLARSVMHENAHLADVRWEPVAAHLQGSDKDEKDDEANVKADDSDEPGEDEMQELADEVEARRKDE